MTQTIDFRGNTVIMTAAKTPAGVSLTVTRQPTIADLTAITGGESPTEAEHNLVVTKVNAILAALEAAGVLASS